MVNQKRPLSNCGIKRRVSWPSSSVDFLKSCSLYTIRGTSLLLKLALGLGKTLGLGFNVWWFGSFKSNVTMMPRTVAPQLPLVWAGMKEAIWRFQSFLHVFCMCLLLTVSKTLTEHFLAIVQGISLFPFLVLWHIGCQSGYQNQSLL